MNTGLESDSNFESTIRIEDPCLPQNVIYQYFIKCIIKFIYFNCMSILLAHIDVCIV